MSDLKIVYRVVEYDDPLDDDKIADGGPTSWLVEERKVKLVRKDGKIQLVRPFSSLGGVIFHSSALGTTFFASEVEAVDAFQRKLDESIAFHERAIARSKRADTWARVWRHHNVKPKQAYSPPECNRPECDYPADHEGSCSPRVGTR